MCSDLQLLLIFTIGAAPMIAGWSPNDGHRRNKENSSPRRLTGYKSWNSDLYPIWKAGDSRWHDCWKGGPISLDVNNDAPTLTGAEATFYINLKFPQNQTIQSDGEIVWAENCTLNGTQVTAGESVYPNDTWQNGDELFPDGRSIPRIAKKKGSKFIFVWQTLGKYQQVVDGPSSLVIVDTADAPLGSYTMEVTVYHYRGRQKFIPIGKANSQFTITDQIPFSVEISQISDLNDADNSFIQNRAILFGIKLHDPSLYLKDADISFSWDFGDGSGTLISRVHTVTHTYLSTGAFNPHVILQAAIPSTMCSTANPTIEDSSPMISTITTDPLPSRGSSVVTLDLTVSSVNSEPTAREVTTGNTSPSQPPTVEPVAVSTPVSDSPVPSSAQQPIIIPTSTGDPIPIPSSTISPVIPASDGAINAAIAISEQATNAATPASDDAINAAIAISEQAITAAIPASDEAITAAIGVTEQAITAAIPASDDAINAAIAISEQAITAAIPASDEAITAAIAVTEQAITAAIPASDEATNAPIPASDEAITAAIAVTEQAITAAIPASDEATNAPIPASDEAITAAIAISEQAITAAIPASDEAITAAIPASDEATNAAIPASDEAITAAIPASDEATNAAIVVTEQSTTVSATMVISESETTALSTNEGLMLVKRQALEDPEDNCLIYRYGTFSATINIVQGIESVEIVQISNVVPGSVAEMQQNAVDFTVTCQGSFPSEICTVVLDADCINPQQTDCSEVLPADECQLILRQFFNSSGTYCVNVSMTNAVSLAVASARVDVNPSGTPNTTEALVLVGMLLIASIIGVVAVTYRKYKEYAPLQQDASRSHSEWIPDRAAVNIFLRNMFGCQRSKVSENSPLLHGCVV
ncbi:premelanosome protein a isoform X2 [Scyliorhinus canicula]|uniref:premelanosome protein a isoform X2 n=1 Tax=Scyliorhinus canicula TaxID=7830 RepID=UPI0018F51E4C|nr:premelanosome protein a isoform X2 [Scyliorhinus canicula]